MTEGMIKIDIEEIMDEIRSNIKKRNYQTNSLSFHDIIYQGNNENKNDTFNVYELNTYIAEANRTYNLQTNHVIQTSGKMKHMIKKIIRKFVQFYVAPIVDDQREFNTSTVRALNQINEFIKCQESNSETLDNLNYEINKTIKREIEINENQCNEIKNENKELKEKIALLDKNLSEIEKVLNLVTDKLELADLKCERLELMIGKSREN